MCMHLNGRQGPGILALVAVCATTASADIVSDVLAMTGGKHVKAVWSRQVGGTNAPFGGGTYRLMKFDTRTGGEAELLGSTGDLFRCKITADGNRVVYNNGNQLFIVDWNGGNNRLVGSDLSLGCVWSSAGADYVFGAAGGGCTGYPNTDADLCRINLANPASRTTVYTGTFANMWLSVSLDGTKLGGHFPWSSGGGVVTVSNGSLTTLGGGCWGSVSPDGAWYAYFDGAHRNWEIKRADGSGYRKVALDGGPGINGWEVYHPRFATNNTSYVTVTGPYDQGSMGGNNIGAGGPTVDIYVGRFDAGMTGVAQWVELTRNSVADFFADVWIDPGTSGPGIMLTPAALQFAAVAGGANPAAQTVTAGNSGGGTLGDVSVSESAAWLTVSRGGSGNAQTLTNTVSTAGLGEGVYNTSVTVSGGGAGNAASYTVKLTVSGPPRLTTIAVEPSNATVAPSGTMQLTARPKDQNGSPCAAAVTWTVSGGGTVAPAASNGAVTEHTTTFTSGGVEGTCPVTVSSGAVSGVVTVTVRVPPAVHLKINCGGNTVTGWTDENVCVSGGGEYTFSGVPSTAGVADAAPAELYRTCRRDNHSYSWPGLADGAYTVRLHFYDEFGAGRAMDYTIEGVKVLDDYAMPTGVVTVRTFAVTVADGNGLQIVAEKDLGNDVFEGGIEIVSQASASQTAVTLTAPRAGQSFAVGQTMVVQWTATADVSGVVVQVSTDGGETWCLVTDNAIVRSSAGWGAYAWVVPAYLSSADGAQVSTVSERVLVKVSDYFGTAAGVTSGVLSVQPSAVAAVRSRTCARGGLVLRGAGAGLLVRAPVAGGCAAEVFGLRGERVASVRLAPAVTAVVGSLAPGAALIRFAGGNGPSAVQRVVTTGTTQ